MQEYLRALDLDTGAPRARFLSGVYDAEVPVLAADQFLIITSTPVDHVVAIIANQEGVITRPAVDDILADSSEDLVCCAKTSYLVLSLLTTKLVWLVGANEQTALWAVGQIVRGKDIPVSTNDVPLLVGPRSFTWDFF